MSIVPNDIPGKVEFYRSRQAAWTSHAAEIGILPPQMVTMSGKITAADNALTAQLAAKQAQKDATTVLYAAVDAMALMGADLLKQIKAKGGETGGGTVYALASIPAPAIPAPVGAPGTAYGFKVALQPTGAVEFSWKCDNPEGSQGTIYNVYRKIESTGAFEYLGGSGTKKFVDFSLPAPLASVTYQIQAIRSTAVGVANEFVVKFGVSDAGAMTATVVDSSPKPTKVAA